MELCYFGLYRCYPHNFDSFGIICECSFLFLDLLKSSIPFSNLNERKIHHESYAKVSKCVVVVISFSVFSSLFEQKFYSFQFSYLCLINGIRCVMTEELFKSVKENGRRKTSKAINWC